MVFKLPGTRKMWLMLLILGLAVIVFGVINSWLGNSFSRFPFNPTQGEQQLLAEGQQVFRYDTFGSEDFWGRQLRLHEAIKGAQLGGIGPGLSPGVLCLWDLKLT